MRIARKDFTDVNVSKNTRFIFSNNFLEINGCKINLPFFSLKIHPSKDIDFLKQVGAVKLTIIEKIKSIFK